MLVYGIAVTAMTATPDGRRVVFSSGDNIFAVDPNGGSPEAMLDSEFVPQFGNRTIHAIAFSPEGSRLAFSVGHEVFVMEVESGSVEKIYEAANRVYWMAWVPGVEEIVLTYGKEHMRDFFFSGWMSDPQGKLTLAVITPDGEFLGKLFSRKHFDARQATPSLSPDGRYVSLTAKRGSVREVVIIATDGSGIRWLTSDGPNTHASWRPTHEPQDSPSHQN
jgi:Tol biopolymer transport system component